MKLSSREKRALHVLLNGPVMRENLDKLVGCSNAPDLVAGLRRKGLKVPCKQVERFDRDGRLCYPGQYSLAPDDKPLAHAWLSGGGNESDRPSSAN